MSKTVTKLKVTKKDIDKVRQQKSKLQETSFLPFWYNTEKGCKMKSLELLSFLEGNGFGRLATTRNRLDKTLLFQNDDGVLKLHNESSIKIWVHNFLMNIEQKNFNIVFKVDNEYDESFRRDVVSMWLECSSERLNKVCMSLSSYADESIESDKDLSLFLDTQHECYVRFQNGVVKITKDDIKFIKKEEFNTENQVWESSIIKKDIKLLKKNNGKFSKFFNQAMYRQKDDVEGIKKWTDEYELSDIAKEELLALRTAYGYLIHDFNTADASKLVFFIDSMSEMGRAEGGNGKSVVMDSIRHWKKVCTQDGKKMGANPTQFQFSNVELDTRFVLIDDITPDFQFKSLFSMISGDMEVERKGVDKFIIEAKKKPKMGITSNYVLAGTDTSDTRRQHIVEFGTFWNRLEKEGETVSDKQHLNGLLFDDSFNTDEWNKFYNFGFECIQEYFKNGLKASSNSSYLTKSIKLQIEGKDGNGQGTQWMIDWINLERLEGDYHNTGISEDELYSWFIKDNLELADEWDKSLFHQNLFKLVDLTKGWYYNKQFAKKGNTKSNRRWQVKVGDKQLRFVKITTDDDTKLQREKELLEFRSSLTKEEVVEQMDYFKDMAS